MARSPGDASRTSLCCAPEQPSKLATVSKIAAPRGWREFPCWSAYVRVGRHGNNRTYIHSNSSRRRRRRSNSSSSRRRSSSSSSS
eukprot:2693078-Pyramimonas_sp.AAC.1